MGLQPVSVIFNKSGKPLIWLLYVLPWGKSFSKKVAKPLYGYNKSYLLFWCQLFSTKGANPKYGYNCATCCLGATALCK